MLLALQAGALAALKVRDFDPKTRSLTIGRDQSGGARQLVVPPSIASIIEPHCKDKRPTSPIFARRDGRFWNKDAWKGPIKEAVFASGLPAGVWAYTLRHSVIAGVIGSLQRQSHQPVAGNDNGEAHRQGRSHGRHHARGRVEVRHRAGAISGIC